MTTFRNQQQRMVYIGPTLSGARLRHHQIFIGYPTYLDAEFAACPQLKKLFIPVENLREAKRQVGIKGTALYAFYDAVLNNKEV